MSAKLDKASAARLLGMKEREVRRVFVTGNGPVIQTHDGTETLVSETDDGVELVLVNRRVPGMESLLDQPTEDAEEADDEVEGPEPAPARPTPAKKAAARGR